MTQTSVCVSRADVINHVLQLGAAEIICSAAKVGQKVGHQFLVFNYNQTADV